MSDDLAGLDKDFQELLRGYTDQQLNKWILDSNVEELANFVDINGNINYQLFVKSIKAK